MFFFFQDIKNNPDLIGFKILNLEVRNNKYIGNTRFQFVSKDESKEGPYFTIIIGQNGTGKSYILRTILDIFREAYVYKQKGKRQQYVSGEYSLTYSYNGAVYQFGNIRYLDNGELDEKDVHKNFFEFQKEGQIILPEELEIPETFIANSIMLTDKFPIVKNGFEPYVYLGVRRESSPSIAGTRTLITRTVDYVVNSITDKTFIEKLKETLNFLELENMFCVSFILKYRSLFFTGNVTSDFFYEYFNKYWKYTRRKEGSPPWSKTRFDNHTSKNHLLVEKLAKFCNEIHGKLTPVYENSKSKYFGYDLLNEKLQEEEYEIIQELRALDLIGYPTISLRKLNNEFDLEESSSGEAHFLSSIVALIATMKHNSLVLIDEPEISLHPNWQMKYMGFLQKIFAEYQSTHFFVATHSHFLISDLDGKKSSIIGLRRGKEIIPELFDLNTYGWSAEQVLLEIFNAPTTRNYYLESRVANILELMANPNSDNQQIKEKINDLKTMKLELREDDPMHEIMNVLYSKT